MAIKVDLCGRLTQPPEVRITPAGTTMMRCEVDCGENPGELVMALVMVGDHVRELSSLVVGRKVRVTGSLRAVRGRLHSRTARQGIEIIAHHMVPDYSE